MRTQSLLVVASVSAVSLAAVKPANADFWVDQSGFGSTFVSVWVNPDFPLGKGDAFTFDAQTLDASSSIPGNIPLPPGANPLTEVSSMNGASWSNSSFGRAVGGDAVAWGVEDEIVVTPTEFDATTSIDVSATILDPTTVRFDIDWSGSDPGVGQKLSWSYNDVVVHSESRVGPWDETFSLTVRNVGDMSRLRLLGWGVATSIPTPGALCLLGLGLAAPRRRRSH